MSFDIAPHIIYRRISAKPNASIKTFQLKQDNRVFANPTLLGFGKTCRDEQKRLIGTIWMGAILGSSG